MVLQDSGLFRLPTELRMTIYEYILTLPAGPDGIVHLSRPVTVDYPKFDETKFSVQALFQTCKQVYNEASSVFYEVNLLEIGGVNAIDIPFQAISLRRWTSSLSTKRRQSIYTLCISGMGVNCFLRSVTELARLPELRNLGVKISQGCAKCYNEMNWEDKERAKAAFAAHASLRTVTMVQLGDLLLPGLTTGIAARATEMRQEDSSQISRMQCEIQSMLDQQRGEAA